MRPISPVTWRYWSETGVSLSGARNGVSSKTPVPAGSFLLLQLTWTGGPHGRPSLASLSAQVRAPPGAQLAMETVSHRRRFESCRGVTKHGQRQEVPGWCRVRGSAIPRLRDCWPAASRQRRASLRARKRRGAGERVGLPLACSRSDQVMAAVPARRPLDRVHVRIGMAAGRCPQPERRKRPGQGGIRRSKRPARGFVDGGPGASIARRSGRMTLGSPRGAAPASSLAAGERCRFRGASWPPRRPSPALR